MSKSKKLADTPKETAGDGPAKHNDKTAAATDREHPSTPPKAPDQTAGDTAATDLGPSSGMVVQQRRRGAGRLNTAFLIILLLITAWGSVGGYLLWQQLQGAEKDIAQQTITTQEALNAANTARDDAQAAQRQLDQIAPQVQGLADTVDNRLVAEMDQLGQKQTFLEDTVKSLSKTVDRSVDDWVSSEVEYLLHIANDRLQLDRDIPTAIAALQAADRRLKTLGDPSVIDIRQKITDEIVALRTTNEPDFTKLALTVDALANSLKSLPLLTETPPETAAATTSGAEGETPGWLSGAMDKLKGQVKISRVDEPKATAPKPPAPLLPPDERLYLKENLRLRLEAARVALLRRNTPVFQDSLKEARTWVSEYFDTKAPATQNAIDMLGELAATELTPPLPDISGSLQALQAWTAKKRPQASDETADVSMPEHAGGVIDHTRGEQL